MNPTLGSTPTHRVKKLLETYTMTAERSMLGPGSASQGSDMAQYTKFYPSYHQVQTNNNNNFDSSVSPKNIKIKFII
jgi:hypothetical protein